MPANAGAALDRPDPAGVMTAPVEHGLVTVTVGAELAGAEDVRLPVGASSLGRQLSYLEPRTHRSPGLLHPSCLQDQLGKAHLTFTPTRRM
jgi:hypothetical protein